MLYRKEVEKMNLDNLEPKIWLELNAKLQAKKNALRKDLKSKGILKKGGQNDYDHYSYFSEAQYKELFTELFSKNNLELKFSEIEYNTFEGSGKNCNGRLGQKEEVRTTYSDTAPPKADFL